MFPLLKAYITSGSQLWVKFQPANCASRVKFQANEREVRDACFVFIVKRYSTRDVQTNRRGRLCSFQVLKASKPPPKLCVTANQHCRDDVFMCGLAYVRFMQACDLDTKLMSSRSNQNWTHFQPPTSKPCSKTA